MDQQVDSTIVLKFAVNAIVTSRKPGIALYQGPDCPLRKTDDGILRRGILKKPQVIDCIEAVLAEVPLDRFPVNAVLYTGDLHMGISVIRMSLGVGISILSGQMAGLHIASNFLNKLPIIVVAVDFQPHQFKGV